MSYSEVEELRKSGNLKDAYSMALSDVQCLVVEDPIPVTFLESADESVLEIMLEESPITLAKRAFAWVLHDTLKENTSAENFDSFLSYLNAFVEIDLDPSEKMVVNQLVWLIGKAAFEFTKENDFDISRMEALFELTSKLSFSKQTKGYSFLFKALHKGLKDSPRYVDLASWWDLWSFIRNDYKYTKLEDGKKIMAVAEQAFNRYAKHLLLALKNTNDEEIRADLKKKIGDFLPVVVVAMQHNNHYNKLPGYHVKLLIANGEVEKGYYLLLKHARQNQKEFWIWEILADIYGDDPHKQIACVSSALLCRMKLDKVIQMRLKLVGLLIGQDKFDEAKTEVGQILKCCLDNKWDIPEAVTEWGEEPWYSEALVKEDNLDMYQSYLPTIFDIIFAEIPEQKIVVEAVNVSKKILNFVSTDFAMGYFKYDKILKYVKEGDVLLVRIKDAGVEGRYNLYAAAKLNVDFIDGILKQFSGEVIKLAGKNFAFADGMFITPDLCTKLNLNDGDYISGKAMTSYNRKKEEWGWKVISID